MRDQTIPLKPGDRVIASFHYQDRIFVITEFGETFTLHINNCGDPSVCIIRRL